jgi:hypothetical protein
VYLQTSINSVLFYDEKINTITFSANSQNVAENVASYKIYRKKAGENDSQYQLLTTLNPNTLRYQDRMLPLTIKYAYAVSTTDTDGNESEKSATVSEN